MQNIPKGPKRVRDMQEIVNPAYNHTISFYTFQRYATSVCNQNLRPETLVKVRPTETKSGLEIGGNPSDSSQNPFTASLDKLVKHEADIVQCKTANVEPKELRCISRAQFEANVRLGGILQAGVLDLTRYLVCSPILAEVQEGQPTRAPWLTKNLSGIEQPC